MIRASSSTGERVVALLTPTNETTLKTFFRDGKNIRLQPANPDFKPVVVAEQDCQIQGVVIGVLRRYR